MMETIEITRLEIFILMLLCYLVGGSITYAIMSYRTKR